MISQDIAFHGVKLAPVKIAVKINCRLFIYD